jgi:hypothetical protein
MEEDAEVVRGQRARARVVGWGFLQKSPSRTALSLATIDRLWSAQKGFIESVHALSLRWSLNVWCSL